MRKLQQKRKLPGLSAGSASSRPDKSVSRRRWLYLTLAGLGLGGGALYLAATMTSGIPHYGYEIVERYPHDRRAFTQGLIWHEGFLYEGTGWYDESSLRKVELESGEVLESVPLPDRRMFGEGIALWNETIIQLTWKHNTAFLYDVPSLRRLDGTFSYIGEGWGLTHDRQHFIMSNGSANLSFRDPETFDEVKRLTVTANGSAVHELNELEYVGSEIYANIFLKDLIARISPESGEVIAWLDLSGLRPPETFGNDEAVLNGIAYDERSDRLFVTGKRWPELYEIRQVELS